MTQSVPRPPVLVYRAPRLLSAPALWWHAVIVLGVLAAIVLGEPAAVQAKSRREADSPCAARPERELSTPGVRPRPLPLTQFPRPPGDTGRGVHWLPTTAQPPAEVDHYVAVARAMHISWVTFLNDDATIGANDYLVQQLVANGIEPVLRVYTPSGRPIQGDLGAMVRHYRRLGVHYFQLYNEPNLAVENEDGQPNIDRYVSQWVAAARPVIQAGGLPGIGALSPGGDYNDLHFLAGVLDRLSQRGERHLLDCAWLAVHNYLFNRPVEQVIDQHGYLSFRLYHALIEQRLGRPLPIIGTEGGTHVGAAFDPAYPTVDATRQVALVLDAYSYLTRPDREPYYFAFSYWIIADAGGGAGGGPAGSPPPLFGTDGPSPLVAALQQLPTQPPAPAAGRDPGASADEQPKKKKKKQNKKSSQKKAPSKGSTKASSTRARVQAQPH